MKKIPTLFERDWNGDRSRVTREVNPECAWVLAGEGRPTRKHDGTAVLVRGGVPFKRYELKAGRAVPEGFEPAQEPDPVTGDVPGWVPADLGAPENRWLAEAWGHEKDGTYELVGPKVQGNPDGFRLHSLVPHGSVELGEVERTYDGVRAYLEVHPMEGIVWHHPDGRMAKIKRRDFGLKWPAKED